MANIYHAKLNINERIFEVYNEVVSINDLLHNLYSKINSDVTITRSNYSYNFADLSFGDKELVIYGRLAKVFDERELNVFDKKSKEIITKNVENSTDYVAFAFDVMKEEVYFCPIQSFGRKEFLDAFSQLIEVSYKEIGYVKTYLLPEDKVFESEFKKIVRLRTFTAVVIPPNAGSDNVFLRKNALQEEMVEANAKELGIYLKSDVRDPINKESRLIDKIKKFASKGYGYIKATGKDNNNEEIVIDTEEDKELQKRTPIHPSLKNSSVEIYERVKESRGWI